MMTRPSCCDLFAKSIKASAAPVKHHGSRLNHATSVLQSPKLAKPRIASALSKFEVRCREQHSAAQHSAAQHSAAQRSTAACLASTDPISVTGNSKLLLCAYKYECLWRFQAGFSWTETLYMATARLLSLATTSCCFAHKASMLVALQGGF